MGSLVLARLTCSRQVGLPSFTRRSWPHGKLVFPSPLSPRRVGCCPRGGGADVIWDSHRLPSPPSPFLGFTPSIDLHKGSDQLGLSGGGITESAPQFCFYAPGADPIRKALCLTRAPEGSRRRSARQVAPRRAAATVLSTSLGGFDICSNIQISASNGCLPTSLFWQKWTQTVFLFIRRPRCKTNGLVPP